MTDNEQVSLEADEFGNYSSPTLEALVEAWDDFECEKIDETEILGIIERVADFLQSQVDQMEKAGESSETDRLDPNRVAILTGFHEHLMALDQMRDFFESGEESLIDESLDRVQIATNQIALGMAGLLAFDESIKVCIRCAQKSPNSASLCAHCGAILPVTESRPISRLLAIDGPQSETESQTTTPNYVRVMTAYDSWMQGESLTQDFYSILEAVYADHTSEYAQVNKTLGDLPSNDEGQAYKHYLQVTLSALQQNIEALSTLAQAVAEENEENVALGLSDLAQATVEYLEAQKLAKSEL